MASLPKEAISQLKVFIHLLKTKPELIHVPDLKFFKDFIESFGGKVPPQPSTDSESKSTAAPKSETSENAPPPEPEVSEESDVELDNTGVIGE